MATHSILAVTAEEELIVRIDAQLNRADTVDLQRMEDGLELVDRFAHCHADLLILDLDLLGEHALQLISILREMDPACRILLLLSPERMALCEQALPQGMISYLVKPLSAQSAARLIRPALPPRGASRTSTR